MRGNVVVTRHAAERWAERVTHNRGEPNSIVAAETAIKTHETAIRKAAEFGAHSVKLPSKHRLIIAGLRVVTVLPQGRFA
jgi:hypothetical protein